MTEVQVFKRSRYLHFKKNIAGVSKVFVINHLLLIYQTDYREPPTLHNHTFKKLLNEFIFNYTIPINYNDMHLPFFWEVQPNYV